jgi:hypothetical protein
MLSLKVLLLTGVVFMGLCLWILSQKMNMSNCFKAFAVDPLRPTPPSDDHAVDLEAAAQPAGRDDVDPEAPAQPARGDVVENRKMEWTKTMITFCLASAFALALTPVQVHSQLPTGLLCLSLAILLGFSSFFVSEFIHSNFVGTARVLQNLGLFFTATAFFMAITTPFPFYLKCISWAVYSICFLTVLISCSFF